MMASDTLWGLERLFHSTCLVATPGTASAHAKPCRFPPTRIRDSIVLIPGIANSGVSVTTGTATPEKENLSVSSSQRG